MCKKGTGEFSLFLVIIIISINFVICVVTLLPHSFSIITSAFFLFEAITTQQFSVLECRSDYFWIFQEVLWSSCNNDYISQWIGSTTRCNKEHRNSESWCRWVSQWVRQFRGLSKEALGLQRSGWFFPFSSNPTINNTASISGQGKLLRTIEGWNCFNLSYHLIIHQKSSCMSIIRIATICSTVAGCEWNEQGEEKK